MHHFMLVVSDLIIVVTTAGIVLQVVVLLKMLLAVRRSLKRISEIEKLYRAHVSPLVEAAGSLLAYIRPKLGVAAHNLRETTTAARQTYSDLNGKVNDLAALFDLLQITASATIARFDEVWRSNFRNVYKSRGLPGHGRRDR